MPRIRPLRAGLAGLFVVAALAVAVLAAPEPAEAQVDDNTRYRIQGTVVGPDGKPFGLIFAAAIPTGPSVHGYVRARTDGDGRFTVRARNGEYRLQLYTNRGRICESRDAIVSVEGADLTGLRVVLTGDPLPRSRWISCQVAFDQVAPAIATELRPGGNFASWIEASAGVETIFEAIPQLIRVQGWDAAERRYRSASRSSLGLHGDLETLTTGMALWLTIRGTEPVAAG